jgi:hypothetical protein
MSGSGDAIHLVAGDDGPRVLEPGGRRQLAFTWTPVADPDPRLALVYHESVRKLDQQAEVLEALRGRTGLLLGAGSISTAFLAPAATQRAGWGTEAWIATGCLVLTALLVFTILWPYRGWRFSHKPTDMLHVYIDGPKPRSIDGMHRWLAVKNQSHFEDNRERLDDLHACFQGATVTLCVSIGCWLVLIAR